MHRLARLAPLGLVALYILHISYIAITHDDCSGHVRHSHGPYKQSPPVLSGRDTDTSPTAGLSSMANENQTFMHGLSLLLDASNATHTSTKPPPQLSIVWACHSHCKTPFWMAVPSAETTAKGSNYAASNVQEALRHDGYWDELETLVASSILERGCEDAPSKSALMLDIGANTGYFSAMALNAGCRVVAFEPTAYHEPYLRTSAALAGRTDALVLHKAVVSDVSGANIPFDGWSVAGGHKSGSTTSSLRVDDVVQESVHYLKMDIEGHEPAGFRGLTRLLHNHRVNFLVWEHTPSAYSAEEKAQPPSRMLQDLGYWISPVGLAGYDNVLAVHPALEETEFVQQLKELARVFESRFESFRRVQGWAAAQGRVHAHMARLMHQHLK